METLDLLNFITDGQSRNHIRHLVLQYRDKILTDSAIWTAVASGYSPDWMRQVINDWDTKYSVQCNEESRLECVQIRMKRFRTEKLSWLSPLYLFESGKESTGGRELREIVEWDQAHSDLPDDMQSDTSFWQWYSMDYDE